MTGKIVVCEDEFTISNRGFSLVPAGTQKFVENIAKFFAGGKKGNFLGYSTNFGVCDASLKTAFGKAGHNFTVNTGIAASVANFKKYDGVWLAGKSVNNQVLIDYVKAGGNVYLMGGTGVCGTSAAEARGWNTFLKTFGLEFGENFNGSTGVLEIEGNHQILEGVPELFFYNGNGVKDNRPNDNSTQVFTNKYGGAIGVYDGLAPAAPAEPAEVKIRITRSGIKKSGSPAPYTISIGDTSKQIHFCRIGTSYECTLDTPGGVDTPIKLEATGRDEPYNGSLIECVEVLRNGAWVKLGPENVWCEGSTPPKEHDLYLGYPYAAVQVFDD